MIVGLLCDVAKQKSVLPAAVVRGIDALQSLNLADMELGRYELEGDKLFYLIQEVTLRSMDESRCEAHHNYADVQIPLSTDERYGFSLPQTGLVASEDLLEEKDVAFYPNPANEFFMDIEPGAYAVFMPMELHRPCLAIKDKTSIRKAVIKIHSSLLGL